MPAQPLPLLSLGISAGLPALVQASGGVPKGYVRLLVFDADSNLVSSQTQTRQLTSAARTGYEPLTAQVIAPQACCARWRPRARVRRTPARRATPIRGSAEAARTGTTNTLCSRWLRTAYAYDDFGHLRYTLQPEATKRVLALGDALAPTPRCSLRPLPTMS